MVAHRFRTHTCGELREEHIGRDVKLSGWIHRVRDHGGILFVDLRDHYGITQVVIHPDSPFFEEFGHCHLESVVCVSGPVLARSDETVNPKLATGGVEVEAKSFEILSAAEVVPITVAQDSACDENVRLRYRFLDLRREDMHRHILLRSQVMHYVRNAMIEMGFNEFHTPILTSSSPEGARDFLVPSRLHPGNFYALPQAPQIYKQLLMVSGFDRYFQIAPCFRDEDSRADRSPGEFYQIDIEMSFVTQDEVFAVVEALMTGLFRRFGTKRVDEAPFERFTYRESMLRFGTDKPDLRIPLEILDVTELFRDSEFKAFASVVKKGGVVRALPVPRCGDRPRSFFDGLIEFVQSKGGKGLAYILWTEEGVKSPIAKFLGEETLTALGRLGDMKPGDVMFFVADRKAMAESLAGTVRAHIGAQLGLIEEDRYRFCWITDYPMFEYNDEHARIDFSHNPFSMPQGGMEALESQDPLEILAYQYDLVCNGVELSSGAIRNHRPDIMVKAFEIAGYTREEVETQFKGLMQAFQYGAPPHGGIAPGFDRILMLLTDVPNIREVIAFPLNQSAQDPLLGGPSPAGERQLRELYLRSTFKPRKPKD